MHGELVHIRAHLETHKPMPIEQLLEKREEQL